jgi:dolichol-phosphate mannosyltransferase
MQEAPVEEPVQGRLEVQDVARPGLRLSVVIPTFNERESLPALVDQLDRLLFPYLGDGFELVVVDDDSPDRTWEAAASLRARCPRLRVVRRRGERGLASAVVRGWQAAQGDVLAVIDADLQHPPEPMIELWREIERGADLAVASRHVAGGGVSDWSLARRLLSRGAQALGLVVLPGVLGRVTDPLSGYFMVRRRAIAGVVLRPAGYKILVEVLGRGRVRWIAEVGYVFREREDGKSKVTGGTYVAYLRHLLRLRLDTLPLSRLARFATVGLSGVVVDMTVLYLLSDPARLAWGLTRSKVVAAELAILNNFVWNDYWTFRDLAEGQPGPRARLRRFLKFNLVCLSGLALSVILLNLQFNLLGMNRYLANAVAIALVTAWNFWLNVKLGWRAAERDGALAANSLDAGRGRESR